MQRRVQTQHPAERRRVLVEDLVELPPGFGGILIQPDDLGLSVDSTGGAGAWVRRHPGLGAGDGRQRKRRAKANGGNCRPKSCVDHVKIAPHTLITQGRRLTGKEVRPAPVSDPAEAFPKEVLASPRARPGCSPRGRRARPGRSGCSAASGPARPARRWGGRSLYRNSRSPRLRGSRHVSRPSKLTTHSRAIARLRRRISRVRA